MAPRRTQKASSSATAATIPHAYTPLGQSVAQATRPRHFWKAFKRRKVAPEDGDGGQRKSYLTLPHEDESQDSGAHQDEEVFRVGDAVMVRDTTPLPVVGLITQLWTIPDEVADTMDMKRATGQDADDGEDGEDGEDDEDDDVDFVPLWCQMRFLYWPSSLSGQTRTRTKGLVGHNEIFYTHRLPRLVKGSRRTARSLAAAEAPAQDDFALGPSVIESGGFTVGEILGHAYIHSNAQEATSAASVDSKVLLHQGKAVTRHLFCTKAVDPLKELFWDIDFDAIAARGRGGKGWDLIVRENDVQGTGLKEWADKEKAKARREGRLIVGGDEDQGQRPAKKRGPRARQQSASSGRKRKAAASSSAASSSSSSSGSSSEEDDDSDESDSAFEDDAEDLDYGSTAQRRSAQSRPGRRARDEDEDDDDSTGTDTSDEDDSDASDEEYGPSKRRKRRGRRAQDANAAATPRTRRIIDLRREARERLGDRNSTASSGAFLPDPTSSLPAQFESVETLGRMTPLERAKRLLHVSTTPSRLPCRTKQAEELLCLLEDSLDSGIGSCIYVSGVPGTGKTATVRGVISQLQRSAAEGQVNPFDFLEINGMKVADAGEAYSMLWSVVGDRGSSGGARVHRSPKASLNFLSKHYATTSKASAAGFGPGKAATIVLMDELDQLLTSRQDVMYNLFSWPSSRNSRLIVIAVANTMDLPERTMSAKVASRLGMTRITFMPYVDRELGEIVRSRLGLDNSGKPVEFEDSLDSRNEDGLAAEGQKADDAKKRHRRELHSAATAGCDAIFVNDAITYAAKRISNVSGDARRMLDVCRRAIELVEASREDSATANAAARVTIADVRSVLDVMVKSSRPSHISRSLSTHAKVLLVSLLSLVKKTGVTELCLSDLASHHRALCRLHGIGDAERQEADGNAAGSNDGVDSSRTLEAAVLTVPLAQLTSLGLVIPVGAGVGPGKAASLARVLLSQTVREDEVRLSLEGDEDSRIRSML
ncbi:unnamed protein product [Parajaminaea phylloscopi]